MYILLEYLLANLKILPYLRWVSFGTFNWATHSKIRSLRKVDALFVHFDPKLQNWDNFG